MTVSTFAVRPSHTSFDSSSTKASFMSKIPQEKLPHPHHQSSASVSIPSSSSPASPPLFTPIWDYDRFPVGPCPRDRNHRISQDNQNPFLIDYNQHHLSPRHSSSVNAASDMARTLSSQSSSSSATEMGRLASRRGSRQGSRHGSRQGSRNVSSHDILGSVSVTTPINSNVLVSLSGSALSPSPHPADADADNTFALAAADASLSISISHHQAPVVGTSFNQTSSPSGTISKFDQYKAQMDRLRSARGPSSPSSSSGPSSPHVETLSSATAVSSPTGAAAASGAKKSTGLAKLFKKASLSKSKKSTSCDRERQPQEQPNGDRLPDSSSSSRSSLLNEKPSQTGGATTRARSRPDPEKNIVWSAVDALDSDEGESSAGFGATQSPLASIDPQRSPLEEQQDRWRDEWLRPSGAIHSMFRDRPSKFNCPHCGAIKVVSHIQFVPGVMSYLVAFGLLFLTLGTLSYLPFRKDHEGTKDCIHWCPECGHRVARFNRANATWEWI